MSPTLQLTVAFDVAQLAMSLRGTGYRLVPEGHITDDQCTILTLRGQVTDLERERDQALGRVGALERELEKAGAEIAQMALGWHADKEGRERLTTRVAELEKHIEEMNQDAGRYFERVKQAEARAAELTTEAARMFEEAAGLLADALRNLPGEQTVQQAGTQRDIQRWLTSRGASR